MTSEAPSPSPRSVPGRDALARSREEPAAERRRPLLLVDIDGVISLFSFEGEQRPQGSFHWIDGMPHILSATAAEHLLALRE